jgi:hypothetical protein
MARAERHSLNSKGATGVLNSLVAMGLFIGRFSAFFKRTRDLTENADQAMRGRATEETHFFECCTKAVWRRLTIRLVSEV